MNVQVSEDSGELVQVDLARQICNCGGARCVHLDIAMDVVRNRGRRWRWLILSAFHKELRRGDVVAARHWAAWLAHCDGPSAPLEYLRKIWSEETVDLDLAVWLHGETANVADGVARFCAAVKVWETPQWWTVFQEWSECLAGVAHHFFGVLADRLARAAAAGDEAELTTVRHLALADLTATARLTVQQAEVFRTRYASRRFESEDFVLAMLLADRLPRAETTHPTGADVDVLPHWTNGATLLLPPVYAYDYHSHFGKARMRAWMQQNPGSGFRFGVDTSPVDLRWAGGLVPLFWRVQVWQLGGRASLEGLAWHELVPEPEALRRFGDWCDWWPEQAASGRVTRCANVS